MLKLSNYQKEYIDNNYATMKSRDICEILNIEYNSLHHYVSRKKLHKNYDSKKYKPNYYEKVKAKDYSYIYSTLGNKIETKVPDDLLYKSKYGKYHVNDNYFSTIDNEWKAYWLGFLYADGCVRYENVKNKNKKYCVVKLSLMRSDIGHVEKFKNSIQSDAPIANRIIKLNKKEYECSTINICNEKIVSDLIRLGCIQNKSLVLKFPNEEIVPKKYLRHFIRGYFDGDGYIHVNDKDRTVRVNIVGTYDFLNSLQNVFIEEFGFNKLSLSRKKDNKAYSIQYGSIEKVEKIFEFLYKDSNIYLQRKLDKFKIVF